MFGDGLGLLGVFDEVILFDHTAVDLVYVRVLVGDVLNGS